MTQSKEFPQYKWVTPKSYTKGRKPGQPTVIFIHTTEGSEGRTSAEDGAAYDARRTDGTSTHFFVDQDSTIQCVLTTDESHATRTHGNDVGISIEVCGKAAQSKAQWADAASAGAIEQAAQLGVALRKKYGKAHFPLVNLTPAQLRAGQHGFAEHKDATLAWPEDHGTHTDPGPNFPWDKMFARITQIEAPPPVQKDDLPVDSKTFNSLFLGALKDPAIRKEVGAAMLEASGWSSGYSGRKLGQHADDDQALRNFLFGKPDEKGQQVPADSPVAKMAQAAEKILGAQPTA